MLILDILCISSVLCYSKGKKKKKKKKQTNKQNSVK